MNAKLAILLAGGVVLAALPAAAQQPEEGVALTVYNGGYGVVRELRALDIGQDGNVKFTDVASKIDATTVHFKSLTDPEAKLLEQNYQYDLVSADKLLQKYIDRSVQVVCPNNTYTGTLLSFDGGQIVLKEAAGITMVQRQDNVRDIRFKMLPEGLLTRPTLVWKIATAKPGRHLAEVTYQTNGLNWHAEYVLVLGAGDASADLAGWVSVQNNSGKTYSDGKLKFIAGDVRRVQQPPVGAPRSGLRARGAAPEPMVEKAFFEYHMYTLPRRSTVADNEIKQLEMFTPVREMKVQKKYLYNPLGDIRWQHGTRYTQPALGVTSPKKVHVFIEFANSKANRLGIPLPAGKVRVYKQDPDDKALEFIGEERIDHTPKDEELSLRIGDAFDIVGERRQISFAVDTHRNWMTESIEIKIRNHKTEDVVVRVKEPLYRWLNWEITAMSADYEKLDARNIAWDVPVKADGEAVVTYSVKYTW